MHTQTGSAPTTAGDSHSLALGKPRFNDADLTQTATHEGVGAAWRQAFQRFGIKAPERVSGDFSIAFRDVNGKVFMAIDRFAVRTLCYRQVGNQLLFAERADHLADPTTEIDPQAIFDYLYLHVIPSPRTIFKGIYRVPPAHYVLFENGKLTVAPYWIPEFQEDSHPSFESLRDEFRHLLRQATERQLDGGKAGCFLSGGTDSSTVAGMIGMVRGTPASTYSIGFEAEGYDEMAFARIAAKRFNTDHHEYYVTPDDLVRSIPEVATYYDQPFGNASALPAYYCAKMAKQDGITRLLAGDGGDELFGGNSRYAKRRIFDWYQHFPRPLRAGLMEPVLRTPVARRVPLLRKAASYVEQASLPMPDRLNIYTLLTRLGIEHVLTPRFLASIDPDAPMQLMREVWGGVPADTNTNRELAFDWRFTLAECDLPKVVGTTALAGLDVGFPMLDDDLLAFSLRLPSEYKLKGLKLRWFFKEALRGFLPDQTIAKKKQGFGLPFGVWATRHEPLRNLASDSVRGLADRGILQPDFADDLLTKRLYEHPGYYGVMVWVATILEQWLRGQSPGFSISRY